ncbi:serine hydrolase domain-containing protein [Brevundimonas sp.]|uniref:serine hydrolase domain-containing protein n=1 Tax=Brevundimonas sp. TaxID=1871086 RepID=UPI002612F9BA|nr:serine hydrolase domain-containing protein [Brevundimonas sp.]
MSLSRRQFALGLAGLPAAASLAALPSSDAVARSRDLAGSAAAARDRFGLPALAVLAARDGAVLEQAAVGVRVRGGASPVSVEDRWHLGSCAKAMTATLMARFVEKGLIAWDAPLAEMLPGLRAGMDPVAARITLHQLLTMTGGLSENPTEVVAGGGPSFLSGTSGLVRRLRAIEGLAPDDRARRRLIAERVLSAPPQKPTGTFGYSNTGYIILGAIAEDRGGDAFETLLEREVFGPLGIGSFGFGAPGSDHVVDQPRGHEARRAGPALPPQNPAADLPAFMRPAGGMNLSLNDWLRFVQDHLDGETDKGKLLTRETYVHLHTVAPGSGQPYACGWGAVTHGGRRLLTHTGNNTLWTATVRAYPASGHVFLYAANDGRVSESSRAFDQVRADLEARHPDF